MLEKRLKRKMFHETNDFLGKDLSFRSGATITNVTCLPDEWWHGTYKGKSGYFPAEYVKLSKTD